MLIETGLIFEACFLLLLFLIWRAAASSPPHLSDPFVFSSDRNGEVLFTQRRRRRRRQKRLRLSPLGRGVFVVLPELVKLLIWLLLLEALQVPVGMLLLLLLLVPLREHVGLLLMLSLLFSWLL